MSRGMGLARRLGCAPRTGTTAGPDTRPAASAGHSGVEVSSSREPPRRISPRRCRWARGQALTPQEVSRGCWHPHHGHSLVGGFGGPMQCALTATRWGRGCTQHPAPLVRRKGTSWGHPEDILGTSISFWCWLPCSRASPQAALSGIQRWRCHPPAPISPKCPQEKVPKGSPRCHQQRDAALTRWAVGDVHSVFSWDASPGLGQRLGLGTRRP